MADRVVTALLFPLILAWFVFIPIEVFSLKLLPPPQFAVSVFGAALFLIGFAIVIAAIYENSFAVLFVEDQAEQGQVLIDTGLYARVRHPLYTGLLLWCLGIALWLESYVSAIAVTVILVVLSLIWAGVSLNIYKGTFNGDRPSANSGFRSYSSFLSRLSQALFHYLAGDPLGAYQVAGLVYLFRAGRSQTG